MKPSDTGGAAVPVATPRQPGLLARARAWVASLEDPDDFHPSHRLNYARQISALAVVAAAVRSGLSIWQFVQSETFRAAALAHPLASLSAVITVASTVPVFIAIKRRRRGGLIAMLLLNLGVILSNGTALLHGPHTGEPLYQLGMSLTTFVMLLSCWKELDQ